MTALGYVANRETCPGICCPQCGDDRLVYSDRGGHHCHQCGLRWRDKPLRGTS